LSDYADVSLVADRNNNGVYDSGEILYEDYSYGSYTADINSALGAGNYFAWVETDSSSNTNYTLSLSATVNTPSDYDDYIIGDYNDNTINGLNGNDYIESNSGNDSLVGGSGNDTLLSGSGDDTMIGGTGNDTYEVDSTGDVVSETSTTATEIDSVKASITYTLGANLENLTLTGMGAINGTGNTRNNTLTGNDADNSLSSGAGNDSLVGGAGNDTMIGWTGNDIYEVDSTGDVVLETSTITTEIDSVKASITYTLGANLENLTLNGIGAINGTGNTRNNTLTGNDANNSLSSGAGNDSLIGGAGNDTMTGWTGNDTMIGGTGNDVYEVESTGDVVSETSTIATEIDLVKTSITYTLGANLENLTLNGIGAINGTGNTLNNILIGNGANNSLSSGAGNDTLNGGAGNDTMSGWTGNDIYVVDSTGDVVSETSTIATEIDSIEAYITHSLGANLEKLTLLGSQSLSGYGNTLNNTLTGNIASNTLRGGYGNDTLNGGNGNDILYGGIGNDNLTGSEGSDRFSFSSKSEGIDRINDFSTVYDTISVSASGFGGGLVANSSITVAQFYQGSAAHDSSDRFIYNSSNGALYFDLDGTGSSSMIQIATLNTGLAMTNADILVDS
jgi:Ca2+-binding RTX toxin-like protein